MKILFQLAHPRANGAHLPKPLTASGAAVALPSCLPSSAKQRNFPELPGMIRPFIPASRVNARLDPERFGGFIVVRPRTGSRSLPAPNHCDLLPLASKDSLLQPHAWPLGRTHVPAGNRGKTSISFQSPYAERTGGHPLRRLNLGRSRSHPTRWIEPPGSGGGFNSSPASGPAFFLNLTRNRSRTSVMGQSDSPGENHSGPFLPRKNPRSPRVRHALNQSIFFSTP